jgi:hypothetical protein
MQRRQFISTSLVAGSAVALPLLALPPLAWASTGKVQSLPQALLWLEQLHAAPGVGMSGKWPLSAVLEHLAQSIDMSMDGFPQPKSALFQNTVGTAAFAVFKWRGQMSHSLAEPIPGAPVLSAQANWKSSAERLRAAITRFQAHAGALKPHFAYGALSKADYALVHSMHIANHQDEISLTRLA